MLHLVCASLWYSVSTDMGKIVIVSNRLPISYKKVDGELAMSRGGGGLATALSTYATSNKSLWIGWPGIANEELTDDDRDCIIRELKKYNCYPVFLTRDQLNKFYNGYSNGVLWPLFHDMAPDKNEINEKNWNAYREVNKLYATITHKLAKEDSLIWVHDYQLLLLPEMLRVKRPKGKIGFFLHIPFPNATRMLKIPHADKLLRGVIGADVVGMHTPSYVQNFLGCCAQTKIGRVGTEKIALSYRIVRVTDFPISIDYESFSKATQTREVALEYKKLQWQYRGKKVILMSDRMDPTKGLLERLTAYRTLLEQSPDLHGKIIMTMIAMPSRGEIETYRALREKIEKLVRDINSQFGTSKWQPIDATYDNIPFAHYAALYKRADVAFIAPIRDGMNLVAKEYLASAPNHEGVLVLSETAGAAEELRDAVLVNPKKPKTLVAGLKTALTMPRSELRRRTANMQRHIKHFDVNHWVDSFVGSLQKPVGSSRLLHRTYKITIPKQDALLAQYHLAKKRLLLFDYDGTLSPIVKHPEDAFPTANLKKLLTRLAGDSANEIVIISGRSKKDLEGWLGDLPIALAAEHGAFFRRKDGKNWHNTVSGVETWKDKIAELFAYYAELTPGAKVEQKECAVVWHYRNASPYFAQKHLVVLRRIIVPIAERYNLRVKEGKKVLEVHPAEIHKGRVSQEWLIHDHDFVMAIGDDTTDEDMFAAAPPDAWTIKVGRGSTKANYRLPDVPAVLQLLRKL